jgi:hypothetical protein
MPITPITNHIDQGLARLITRYRGRPRFAAWCASHIRQSQLLEDACWELVKSLDVDTADLPRLTLLGKIVGQTPTGTLEEFRRYVKTRILVNRSRATAPNLIKIATIIFGVVTFRTMPMCSIVIEADNPVTISPEYGFELLRRAKGAGIRLQFVFSDESAFEFASGTAYVDNPSHGFAPTDLSYGGAFSALR